MRGGDARAKLDAFVHLTRRLSPLR
jgi:hypothetical protein